MQMQEIERAVETLRAMAAIPCLRGGYVSFDCGDDLRAVGWSEEECYGGDPIVCVVNGHRVLPTGGHEFPALLSSWG